MRRPQEKVWVVRPGDGATVGAILARARIDAAAIEDGRVFVGRFRVRGPEEAVRPGDAVRIAAPAEGAQPTSARPPPEVELLFQQDGLVACIKPAGIPTVADQAGAAHALVTIVAKKIGLPVSALVVTSRLDREVSGAVVFAVGAAAAERLKQARAAGVYRRRYVAIAALGEAPLPEAGIWAAPIGRAADPHLRAAGGPDAKEAKTAFVRIATADARTNAAFALLAVDPVTGRTHQIRVHAGHAGAPLVGDAAYGGPKRIVLASGAVVAPARVALHAARVVVPGLDGPIAALAPIPSELRELWAALGGSDPAWERALAVQTPVC
jgi:23S rRNA-/tRNA-specific pseudouridylate synthase